MEVLSQIGAWSGFALWALLLLAASLLVYLGLGGTFVIIGLALIHGVSTGFESVGWPLLAVLLGIALFGEGVEFVIGNFYVAKKGAGGRGIFGAFVGGLVGAVVGASIVPVFGAVPGSFIGAFAGAILGEYWRQRRLEPSLRIGMHSFLGRLAAISFKHGLSLVMVVLVLRATWPGQG